MHQCKCTWPCCTRWHEWKCKRSADGLPFPILQLCLSENSLSLSPSVSPLALRLHAESTLIFQNCNIFGFTWWVIFFLQAQQKKWRSKHKHNVWHVLEKLCVSSFAYLHFHFKMNEGAQMRFNVDPVQRREMCMQSKRPCFEYVKQLQRRMCALHWIHTHHRSATF